MHKKIEGIEKEVGSNTFCILPWIHLSTRPGGTVRVCCTANASSVGPTNDKKYGGMVGTLKGEDGEPQNVNDKTFLEIWNSSYMKNVRQQMLAGEQPPSCLKCYKEESAGHRSKRQWETEYWFKRLDLDEILKETNKDGSVPPKVRYVDLRLGTKCQLSCVMCSPHDSSGWIKDWQAIHPKVQNNQLKDTMNWSKEGPDSKYNWHKNNPKFWDELYDQIPHMRQLYFAGGESTIIKEHYDLLEKVVDMGYAHQIELRYNSNGVEMPERLFNLWNKFQRVRFHYSIDSIGEMNNYIRYPSDWNHQKEIFDLLDRKTGDNVEITVACAVQVLNVYYIPDMIKWKLHQGFKKINPWPLGAGLINYHFVYHPPHMNVKILPQWFKEECKRKYEKFYPWLEENWQLSGAPSKDDFINAAYGIKRLKGLISFMMSEDWSNRMDEFVEYIRLVDKTRGTDFKNTFPEMSKLI